MPAKKVILGPARDEIQEALQSPQVQGYIISCGPEGAKRSGILSYLWSDDSGLEGGPVRYSEWTLTRLWLKSLGYRSTRESGWNWVHPHYFTPAIPLMPMTNGMTFQNGNLRKSNLTTAEKAKGTGHPNSWADRADRPNPNPTEARAARQEYREELEPGEGEIVVEAHTRADGNIEIPEHIRKKPTFKGRRAQARIEVEPEGQRPAWVQTAENVEGITVHHFDPSDAPELEPEMDEIVLRISVPKGVNVTINGDRPGPAPEVAVIDGSTLPLISREEFEADFLGTIDGHIPVSGRRREQSVMERRLLIGQKITQQGHFEGQIVLDHITGSQYVVGFSVHGDGREYAYHKKQGLDGSDITVEMDGGWRPWVSVDD